MPDEQRPADVPSIADAIFSATQRHESGFHDAHTAAITEREAEIRTRISKATTLENVHRPARPGWCVCHRAWPCSVVLTAREILEQASRELKDLRELPDTVVLPVIRDDEARTEDARPPVTRRRPRLRVLGARRRRDQR